MSTVPSAIQVEFSPSASLTSFSTIPMATMCSPDGGELSTNIYNVVADTTIEAPKPPFSSTMVRRLSPVPISPCNSSDESTDDGDSVSDPIGQLFDTQADAIEKWLREKAPPDILRRMHRITEEARSKSQLMSPKRTSSVTSDLFQQWMASSSSSTSPMMVSVI